MVKCVFSFQHDTMNTTLCYFEDVNIICTSARELFAAFFTHWIFYCPYHSALNRSALVNRLCLLCWYVENCCHFLEVDVANWC